MGKTLSEETKKKLSNVMLGNKYSLGIVQSEETKRKKLESYRKTIELRKSKKNKKHLNQ